MIGTAQSFAVPSAHHATSAPPARHRTNRPNRKEKSPEPLQRCGAFVFVRKDEHMHKRTKADSPTKLCTLSGCDRALRARGLCASHYNQAHCQGRHAPKLTACVVCGVSIMRARKADRRPTCSPVCRHALAGQQLTGRHDWSSTAMSRARKHGAPIIEAFTNTEIFERDNWTCYLCQQPVNRDANCFQPDSATVDHVTPLSLQGEHSRANARCACLRCNSAKQAALIGA